MKEGKTPALQGARHTTTAPSQKTTLWTHPAAVPVGTISPRLRFRACTRTRQHSAPAAHTIGVSAALCSNHGVSCSQGPRFGRRGAAGKRLGRAGWRELCASDTFEDACRRRSVRIRRDQGGESAAPEPPRTTRVRARKTHNQTSAFSQSNERGRKVSTKVCPRRGKGRLCARHTNTGRMLCG